ncbi:hypothetical protein H310_03883 [Aphanomyces invadans]|uniref:Uncharacterized protein n=1 Tax=Aphanomyces invadans TaxID=157072 RepID=A0A024UEN1_9STRA|nr:hypothetical protein H310_03883 [Aphanomyces invadans]ETW04734.1 hypothetical protein H310_03883 [Aphanomyces invadans]|eukprot:XP_008866172.1 hypothetical protein H310_03883 [Aphanomyces invadans]
MATRMQRLVRAFLRRHRAAKTLVRAARNLLSKKVWSTALVLGSTSVDEPYYALWLSRGTASVSCIQRRKRGFLKLDSATSRVLNALHEFRSSKSRTKDWEFAALEVLGQVEVVEESTSLQLTIPPEYTLGKALHRSESLAQVNKTKPSKRTPTVLEAAAALSIPDLLDSLHDGRDVNERDATGQSPLHVAITSLNVDSSKVHDVVGVLLDHGADVNAKDFDGGYTALHHACAKNQCGACEALLEAAQERHIPLNISSYDGMYPLHVLAILGHVECACVLQQGDPAWDVNVRDAEGRSPLHLAIAYNHSTFVTYLLEMGATPDARDGLSRTPLHYAVECKVGLEMVSSLRKFKVDLNAADERGDTALHWAAHSGHQKLVNHLVNLGADTTLQNTDWETPAQLAAANGHEGCVAIFARSSKKHPIPSHAASPSVSSYVSMGYTYDTGAADSSNGIPEDSSSGTVGAVAADVPPEALQWVYDEYGGCYDTATGTYWSPDGQGGFYNATEPCATTTFTASESAIYDSNNYCYSAPDKTEAWQSDAENAKAWADYYASQDPATAAGDAYFQPHEQSETVEAAVAPHSLAHLDGADDSLQWNHRVESRPSDEWTEPWIRDDEYLIDGVPHLSHRDASMPSSHDSSSVLALRQSNPAQSDEEEGLVTDADVPDMKSGAQETNRSDTGTDEQGQTSQTRSSRGRATATGGRVASIKNITAHPPLQAINMSHSPQREVKSVGGACDPVEGSKVVVVDRAKSPVHESDVDEDEGAKARKHPSDFHGRSSPIKTLHDADRPFRGDLNESAMQTSVSMTDGLSRSHDSDSYLAGDALLSLRTEEVDVQHDSIPSRAVPSRQGNTVDIDAPVAGTSQTFGGGIVDLREFDQTPDEDAQCDVPWTAPLSELSPLDSNDGMGTGQSMARVHELPLEATDTASTEIDDSTYLSANDSSIDRENDGSAIDTAATATVPVPRAFETVVARDGDPVVDATIDQELVDDGVSNQGWSDEWAAYYGVSVATGDIEAGPAPTYPGAFAADGTYKLQNAAFEANSTRSDSLAHHHATEQGGGVTDAAAWAEYYASLAARDEYTINQDGSGDVVLTKPLDSDDYSMVQEGHDIHLDEYMLHVPQLDTHRSTSTLTTSHHSVATDHPKTVRFADQDDDGDVSAVDIDNMTGSVPSER